MTSRDFKPQNDTEDLGGGVITSLFVHGYKSLAQENYINIRPLTVLAGANSSGKSSALQPLLLLKQTLEATYDPGPLLLDGPNVRFTSVEQFFSKITNKRAEKALTVGVKFDNSDFFSSTFIKQPKGGLQLKRTGYGIVDMEFTLGADMTLHQDVVAELPEKMNSSLVGLIENLQKPIQWHIERNTFFLIAETEILLKGATSVTPIHFSPIPIQHFQTGIQKVIHVPGLRGNPERTYRTTSVGLSFSGTFEPYVASVITHWQNTKDDRLEELRTALQILGLTQVIDARQIDDTQVELRVGRLPYSTGGNGKEMVNITDVGFGVSQILPVLVALLVAEPGQLVYLEQPEIHLHPKAQVALAKVLADAAKRGVRVVAETHSDLLLLAIQTLVAEGYIAPEEVILHWFNRRKNGATEITTAELDEVGAYGDWPEDFDIVSLKAHNRYISAAEARLMARENG